MANRDKSQGVAFANTNIYQLYKKSREASNLSSDAKVWRAEDLQGIQVTKFQAPTLARPEKVYAPRTLSAEEAKAAAVIPVDAAVRPTGSGESPFDDLKSNLNRLQDLHARLRFMLKELEDLVNKK